MSRHIIPNAPGSPLARVTTVGWDAPLSTFFAMAFDGEDDVEVFWIGYEPNEIRTVEVLDAALKELDVDLPASVAALLVRDKADEGDRSDNPGRRLLDAMAAEGGVGR